MANASKPLQTILARAHGQLDVGELSFAFGAARRALTPAEVFDMFSSYLTGGVAEKKKGKDTTAALQAVDAGLSKITPHMDDAARSLGHGPAETLRRVHLPLLRGSVLTAALLVFIDVMKELPATLVMRPFNFDTLATQAYTLASDERLAEASTAALAIVAVGLLPMMILCRQIARGQSVSAH